MKKSSYLIRIGDALSQFANVVLLNGHPNESISGRAYREHWVKTERAIDFVFGKYHCREAYKNDIAYAQSILVVR